MSRIRPDRRETTDRHEIVRRANIQAVFRVASTMAPVSRDEIAAATGLSRPTVISLVAALVDQGLIRVAESRPARRTAGRIAVRYEPNPKAAYVVGIDVGGTKSHAGIADLAGEILAEEEVATTQAGGTAVLAQIATLARSVAGRAGVEWGDVGILSLGTPGVENDDGTIRLADNVNGLDRWPLSERLARRLGVPVVWENDVNVAALGEHLAGAARGCDNFVLLSIGTGLGMGVVIDGRIVRGWRGAAGEVAYLPIGAEPGDPLAQRYGAFEVAAAGRGVVALYRAEHGNGRPSPTAGLTARDVYAGAGRGDPEARRAVERHAELLARGILAVSAVIDPELIVLGGGIGTNPVLLDPLRRAVADVVPWPLRLEPSALGQRAGLLGAVHRGLLSLPRLEPDRVSSRLTGKERPS